VLVPRPDFESAVLIRKELHSRLLDAHSAAGSDP
jgi:hypothetical protein